MTPEELLTENPEDDGPVMSPQARLAAELVDLSEETVVEPEGEKAMGQKMPVDDGLTYDDLVLPAATIAKIMKDVLPDKCSLSKDVRDMARRVAVFFILYVTESASVIASTKKRKTVSALDVLAALQELDFEDMAGTLTGFLRRRKTSVVVSKKSKTTSAETETVSAVAKNMQQLELNEEKPTAEEEEEEEEEEANGQNGESTPNVGGDRWDDVADFSTEESERENEMDDGFLEEANALNVSFEEKNDEEKSKSENTFSRSQLPHLAFSASDDEDV